VASILKGSEWRLVASPFSRTVDTMRIVLEAAGRSADLFKTDAVLREASYGDWEGLTLSEIASRHPEMSREREADKWGFVPPAGESYAMVSDRVATWLDHLDRPTLMVAHGGILRALLHLLAGLPAHDAPHLAVPQDRVILFTPKAVFTI
jgi:broad specificity phosphatase PhoE